MLPVRSIQLYQNGVAHITRSGSVSGSLVEIPIREKDLDDALKSISFTVEGGRILSFEYDSIRPLSERIQGLPSVDPEGVWPGLLNALQGKVVELSTPAGSHTGRLVGMAPSDAGDTIVIYGDSLLSFPAKDVVRIKPADGSDLVRYLEERSVRENSRILRIRKEEGTHTIAIHLVVPASVWRISYRLLRESGNNESGRILLAAFALFDNPLEEKLENVRVTCTTGLPVSFRYNLKSSRIPERPVVAPENERLIAPPAFAAVPPPSPAPSPARSYEMAKKASAPGSAGSGEWPGEPMEKELMRASLDARLGADAFGDSLATDGSGRRTEGLTRFDLATPVNLESGGTACVPLFTVEPGGEVRILFNRNKMESHPVLTHQLQNVLPHALDAGPVTLFENGEYGGESMMPFTPAGAEAILAFSQELAIAVTTKRAQFHVVEAISIQNGAVLETHRNELETTYTIRNRLDEEKTIWIEHNPHRDTSHIKPEGDEKEPSSRRYRVLLPPDSVVYHTVHESWESAGSISLSSVTPAYLEYHESILDESVRDRLTRLLQLYARAAEIEEKIERIENENRMVREKQDQVRKNISSLTGSGEEAAFRSQLARKLMEQEKRLEELDQERERAQESLAKHRQMIAEALDATPDSPTESQAQGPQ